VAVRQIARARSVPHGVARRTQMILLSADGQSISAIGRRFGVTAMRGALAQFPELVPVSLETGVTTR